MFGYNYHYAINESKNTIKLRPTMGTYAKAALPGYIIMGAFWVALAAMSRREESVTLTEIDPDNE